jgi:ABC-type branched-subunit amino acid transport system ATPase component
MEKTGLMINAIELRRSFKNIEAVSGASFQVHHGEIFGLLGPNGAGKTTTIRLLTRQIDPNGGRAVVAGCDVVKDRARLKERIGVVFEEQNLYERLSGRHNLRFNCWLYNLPERRIDIIAGIFVGQLGEMLSSSPAYQIARILPTYYIAEGAYNASRNLGSLGSNLLDAGVILGSTLVLLAISVWVLRRQSAVLALI